MSRIRAAVVEFSSRPRRGTFTTLLVRPGASGSSSSAIQKRNIFSWLFSKSDSKALNPQKKFDTSLLPHLVCPLTKSSLVYRASTHELINEEYGVVYPITDEGIPILCVDDARRFTEAEIKELESRKASEQATA